MLRLTIIFSSFVEALNAIGSCESDSRCFDGSSLTYYHCEYCTSSPVGSACPAQDSPECLCSVSSTVPSSHTFYLNTAATTVLFSDYQDLFTFTPGCSTPPSCSWTSSVPQITSTSLAEIQVEITSLYSGEIIIYCNFGISSSQVTVPVNVVCGSNSTTLQPSSFATTQTFDLAPDAVPAFDFVPYTSTESDCPLIMIKAFDVDDSTHPSFDPEPVGNQLMVVASEKYARRTLNFRIYFQAQGGASSIVESATLVTQCTPASMPLDVADYPSQQIEVGSSTVYYQTAEISPVITDCAPLNYFVGSSAGHLDTPTSLSPTVSQQDGNLLVSPLDPSLKQTHTFYLWMELPDSAMTSVGPINLMVGCSNYLDPTLVQDTAAQAQQVIGSSGQPNHLAFQIGDSNVGKPGHYRLHFEGFQSTRPSLCSPDIKKYTLSSSIFSIVPVSAATLEPFSEGEPSFKVTLDTAVLGTFSFYVHGQDTETRWVNTAVSSVVTIEVTCGSEILSTSSSVVERVYSINSGIPTISVGSEMASYFVSSQPACPVATFSFFKDANLATPWDDSLITISGPGTSPILSIVTSDPFVKNVYVRGESEGGSTASLELLLVVCGNERAWPQSAEPQLFVFDSGMGTQIIYAADLVPLYDSNTTNSHQYCVDWSVFRLSEDSSCQNFVSNSSYRALVRGLFVYTTLPFPQASLFLCMVTRGQQLAAKPLQIEVCGSEIATADPNGFQSEAKRSSTKASFANYQSLFSSSSQNCGIRNYTLYHPDEAGPLPYDGSKFELDESFNLLVDTSEVGEFMVLIEGAALASKAYLPVKITVTESSDEQQALINMPPLFTHPPEPVNVGSSYRKKTISLPAIVDFLQNYCGLYVDVPSLGKAFVSNSSAVSSWMGASSDSESIRLQLDPPSLTVENIEEMRGRVVTVQIQLVDRLEASSAYVLELTFESEEQTEDGSHENEEDEDSNLIQESDEVEDNDNSDESQFGDNAIEPTSSGTMSQDFFRLIMEGLHQEAEVEAKEEVQLSTITLMEISRDGRVFFQFNQEFFVPLDAASLSSVNLPRDIARIRIISAEETGGLAFSANLEEWEADHLVIRLNFSEPLLISQKAKPDILEVTFKDPSLFISKRSRHPVDSFYLSHVIALPRQFPSGIDPVAVETAAKTAEGSLLVLSIIQLGMQAILKGLMDDLWGLFFSLQLVCYTQLFAIAFPANAELFLQSVRNLIEFKALKPDAIVGLLWGPEMTAQKLVYKWIGITEWPSEVLTRGKTALEELQIFIAAGLAALLGLIVALLLSLFKKLQPRIEAKLKALKAKMIWSGLIRSVTISYCSICILAKSKAESSLEYGTSSMMEPMVIFAVAFGFPLLFALIVSSNRTHLREKEFSTKFEILMNGLQLRQEANPWTTTGAWLFSLLLARRWLLCALPVIFFSSPAFQLQGLMALTMTFSAAYFYIDPHADPVRRRVERANQLLVCLATYTMIGFSDFQPDPMRAFSAGYWLLSLLIGLLSVNVIGMAVNILRRLRRKRKLVLLKALAWSQRGHSLSPREVKVFRASATESQKLEVETNLKKSKVQEKPKASEQFPLDLSSSSISSPRGASMLMDIRTPDLHQDGPVMFRGGEQLTFETPLRSKKALTNVKKKGRKKLATRPEGLTGNPLLMPWEPSPPIGVKLKTTRKKSKQIWSRKHL